MLKLISKKNISLFIICFINFIFLIKYLSRYTTHFFFISLVIIVIQFVIIHYNSQIFIFLKRLKITPIVILFLFCIILLFITHKIPIEFLKIDRWSVITSFWDNYFNNLYVYKAKSFDGNYPGPMPFYFLIMLPFYYLKEYSYVTIIGIILFFYKIKTSNKKELFIAIVFTSVFIYYEVVARSNIFLNATLILYSLIYFLKNKKNIVINGIFFGLLLSTRNVFVIVYGIALLFTLKERLSNLRDLVLIGITSIFIFSITFFPFIYNHFDDFLKINPFIIQSSALLPFNYSLSCIFASLLLIFFTKNTSDVFFYSGIALFLTIFIYFLYWIINIDFETAFFNSYADITYFIFCIPFLIYYYIETKNPEQVRD